MHSYRRIFYYLAPHIKRHRVAFITLFVAYGLGTALDNIVKPYIYKLIIDGFVTGSPTPEFVFILLHFVALLAVCNIIYWGCYRMGDYVNVYGQSKVMKELHEMTLKRLFEHSYSFFSSNYSGGLIAKAKRLPRAFETFVDVVSFQLWFSFVGLVGVLAVLFWQAPLIAYVFLAWSALYVTITCLFLRKKMRLDSIEAEADSLVTSRLSDVITNIFTVKIFGGEKRELEEYKDVTNDEEKKRRTTWYFANYQNAVQGILMALLQISVLVLVVHLWSANKITVGTAVLIQTYMVGLFDILWSLGRSITNAMRALTEMKEVVELFDTPPDISDPMIGEASRMKEGSISFNAMSFRYIDDQDIFSNFDLAIPQGERVGLVGHSGSGKSTIMKLLLRFLDVDEGSITIDGQDIRSVTQNDLRAAISYVPQEPILFHRSIKENIAYGRPTATYEEIIEVAKQAHAHDFIESLQHGYDTLVGERGVKLSGGERQRIAIARAMLKDSPILILDEATSSLDSVSEHLIQGAFDELTKGRTTIVIAHRLSTIQKLDRIIVLDKGAIVEDGSHEELLKRKGIYYELWSHQKGGFLEE